ncbi:hypothetical protein Taro_004916 [Colocasia esculenta]|uniref:Uncharacterized protein n=1 Tax=Colocasia esculenta TaxID=4460 RepID=A0A843TNP0_COLES|nr:hypothetical protein [Colocasia esculenta]
MQPFRRFLSFGHRSPSIWGASRDLSLSCLSPRRRPTPVSDAIHLKPACSFETGHLEEGLSDSEDPSDFLKQDLDTMWELTKKFQLPAVLLWTVLFGWHHPIILAINVTLILFCTRPNPFSVYIFIEQFLYVKKVEVEDYKLFCFAKVEVSDAKLRLIGILGSWWILQS